MRSGVNGLRFQAQCQRLAGAIHDGASLGKNDPFFQVLPLAEPFELLALQDLQLKRPAANHHEKSQKEYLGKTEAQTISGIRAFHGKTMT
jgi:hypothetical protein